MDIYFFEWPVRPAWLYALTQGLHIVTGLAAIPILLAKLWAVIPQLFERPAVRSLAHALERAGLALLVGGSLFVFATGILNIQLWYPFGFSFVPAHYYAALVFIAALAFHVVTKVTSRGARSPSAGWSRRCATTSSTPGPSRRWRAGDHGARWTRRRPP